MDFESYQSYQYELHTMKSWKYFWKKSLIGNNYLVFDMVGFNRHYHSMEVFAHFDIITSTGVKIAEGHKASFCLEDNQCGNNAQPVFKCANYGDQGISVNCTDTYAYNIDCQWIDITDIDPGVYTFKVPLLPFITVWG